MMMKPKIVTDQPLSEPSVLDYVRSQLRFWEKEKLNLEEKNDSDNSETKIPAIMIGDEYQKNSFGQRKFPWLLFLSIGLAILAQILLEPSANRPWLPSAFFYFLSLVFLIFAVLRKQILFVQNNQEENEFQTYTIRIDLLGVSLGLAIIAFFLFGVSKINFLNLLVWFTSIVVMAIAFWMQTSDRKLIHKRLTEFIKSKSWNVTITPWRVLLFITLLLIALFQFFRLNSVPREMISDQAERVISVSSILKNYEMPLFFPRSTTSEPLPFYWSAFVSWIFNLKGTFIGLKLASSLALFVSCVFIYKLGNLLGGKLTGLLALLVMGLAYWPNLQARASLGGIYFPLFLSISFYYLLKGLLTSRRNLIVIAAIFSACGLLSAREALILPLLNSIILFVFYVHQRKETKHRSFTLFAFLILFLIGLVSFVPVLRVITADPKFYLFRIFSRLSDWERALPANGILIFLNNFWTAFVMPFWTNASSWVDSISKRPALDVVSAALFFWGFVIILIRYIKEHQWLDLAILISYPVLLLPSILSLAFPEENPSLARASGSMVPVFIIVGYGFSALVASIKYACKKRTGTIISSIVVVGLLIPIFMQNYRLIFRDYNTNYQNAAHNTSEIASVVRQFVDTIGSQDQVWLIGYPHWVDSRLLALESGLSRQDLAIPLDEVSLNTTALQPGNKLFLLHPDDSKGLTLLQEYFPQGILSHYNAALEHKDFMIFLIPSPEEGDI